MEYLNEIVSQMLNKTFSVFCGAGADCDATKQQWQDIFTEQTRLFYQEFSSDIYFLADIEKRYYNADSFIKDICENIQSLSGLESEHINNIVNLNINQIWTTNFDCIIENTINRKMGFFPTIIKESSDLLTGKLNTPYIIYKLNGCVSEPDTMVLTKTDFFNYLKKQRLMFEMLKRQLVLDTFLFIGYSFADDLVLNALREIKEVFPNKGKTHYRFVVTNDNESSKQEYSLFEEKFFLDEYNIKSIHINEYSDIDVYLKKLYERFCNHNVLIAGSFRQLKNNDERIYIENLVGSIVQSLVNNNYNIYSGNGRGLGEIVIAQINKNSAEAHFVNRPLIFTNDSTEQKADKNRLIMKDCDTMLIICGQDDGLKSSQNVINQFLTFMKNEDDKKFPLVIPIPSTAYAAEQIFNSYAFKNSSVYLTNKECFDLLSVTEDIKTITRLVVNLIKSYKDANS